MSYDDDDQLDYAEEAYWRDYDDQRDYAEEAYWRDFCEACGQSPCAWDGTPDGFHADDDDDDALPEPEAEQRWQDAVEAFRGEGPYATGQG